MARYIYHGPAQDVSLAVGLGKSESGEKQSRFRDFHLATGKETPDLPDDNPIVLRLKARGLLTPLATAKSAPKPAKSEDEGAKK